MPRIGALLVLAVALPAHTSHADDEVVVVAESPPHGSYSELCATERGVVGRRPCPYGVWGEALEEPYVFMGIGVYMRRLPRQAPASGVAARRIGPAIPLGDADRSLTVAQRFGIAMAPFLFAGLETEIAPTIAETLEPGARSYAAGLQGLVGLQGGTKTLELGVEVAGGIRFIDTAGEHGTGEELLLEARARLDLWLTPWVSIGGTIGASLIDQGDSIIGIQLGLHSYAYGGH